MPTRGINVLPSATGGALTRATGVLLETQLARQAAEREEAFRDRQLDVAESANAINQFVTLAGFTPPGTTLGDLGSIGARLFERGWGMSSQGVEDLELNPDTLMKMIERAQIAGVESGDIDIGELVLPSIRGAMGLETDEDVAALANVEARLKFNALTDIMSDPDMMGEYTGNLLGRDPVTLRIPGIDGAPDREVVLESPAMAQLYAAFLMAREKFSMELDLVEGDNLNNFIEEIQKAVVGADHEVSSTALKGRILPMYNEAVQTGDTSAIQEFLNAPGVSEGQKLAMQYLLGSIGVGEEAFLGSLPPELANFYRIGKRMRELVSPEEFGEIMPSITENLQPGFSARLQDRWMKGLKLTFSGGATSAQPGAAPPHPGASIPGGGNLDLSQFSREDLIQVAQDAVQAGEMGIEDLVGTGIPQDVVDEAFPAGTHAPSAREVENTRIASVPEGGFDPDSVPADIREKVIQYNKGLETQASMTGPSDFLQRNLDQTRRQIEARLGTAVLNEPVDVSQYESETHRAIARRMNTLIKVRSRATSPERIRQLGERIKMMAQELNLVGA